MIERYPLGTMVHVARSCDPDAPIVVGTIRGYVQDDALLRTDNSPMFVPSAAIKGRFALPPAWWSYLPVATQPCVTDRPTGGFCPPIVAATPTPAPIVVPATRMP